MSKGNRNKNKAANAATAPAVKANDTDAKVDKDQVKDTGNASAKKETINFAGTILNLKAGLEKAGFAQSEVKAQRFVFEMSRGDATHRICSVNHARQDSRRKVFMVIVGVPEGLDTKARPYVAFSERGAATSGSKPAFMIRVDRHTLDTHWAGDTEAMIKDVIATVKEASAIRGELMDKAAVTAKAEKVSKAKADKADKASKAAKDDAPATNEDDGAGNAADDNPDEEIVDPDDNEDFNDADLDD